MFGPIWLKFFMVTHETIIYRLVMRNNNVNAFLDKNHIFCWGNRRSRHVGAQDPTKKGQALSVSRKPVFKNFEPDPPPLFLT